MAVNNETAQSLLCASRFATIRLCVRRLYFFNHAEHFIHHLPVTMVKPHCILMRRQTRIVPSDKKRPALYPTSLFISKPSIQQALPKPFLNLLFDLTDTVLPSGLVSIFFRLPFLCPFFCLFIVQVGRHTTNIN